MKATFDGAEWEYFTGRVGFIKFKGDDREYLCVDHPTQVDKSWQSEFGRFESIISLIADLNLRRRYMADGSTAAIIANIIDRLESLEKQAANDNK
jgi:hypothetical protein